MNVYILFHSRELPNGREEVKTIGVYSTEQAAQVAQARAVTLSGFRDHPKGFSIDEYAVDRSYWTDGFVTV